MQTHSAENVPFPPEPGALLGLTVKAELWSEVAFALFDDSATLKQTIVGMDGVSCAKVSLRPLRVDTNDEHSFQMEAEVVDVLWTGDVQ